MANKPQVITGVNVFVDGMGHLGTAKKATLPKVSMQTFEDSSGGVTREVLKGVLEKLESEFTLSEYSPVVYAALAAQGLLGVSVIYKANILQNGENKALVAVIKGNIKEIDDGEIETGKEVERKVSLAVNFYALEINGTQGVMIDADNMIYMVDGVDLLSAMRQNLR